MAKRIYVGVTISEKCNACCRHCLSMAAPSIQHIASPSTLKRIIDQVARNKIFHRTICLTGGEPLLFPKIVSKTIRYARGKNLGISIVTNGFWGKSVEAAKRILEGIKGCAGIQLSTDIFHQEFVPFQRIINSARACLEMGINVSIRGLHYGFTETAKKEANNQLKKVVKRHLNGKLRILSTPLKIGGRATDIYKTLPIKFSSSLPRIRICSLLDTLLISSYGDVYLCCSNLGSVKNQAAVVMGNINHQPLDLIVEKAKKTFLPRIIYKYGIKGLLKIIETLKGRNYVKKYYKNIQQDDECQICTRLFEDREVTSLLAGISGKNAP